MYKMYIHCIYTTLLYTSHYTVTMTTHPLGCTAYVISVWCTKCSISCAGLLGERNQPGSAPGPTWWVLLMFWSGFWREGIYNILCGILKCGSTRCRVHVYHYTVYRLLLLREIIERFFLIYSGSCTLAGCFENKFTWRHTPPAKSSPSGVTSRYVTVVLVPNDLCNPTAQ